MVAVVSASDGGSSLSTKVLAFAALVEMGTGVALLLIPALVVGLLLGADLAGVGIVVARCFGIALIALAWACWPGEARSVRDGAAAARAMLIYNALIALYLGYLGVVAHMAGLLLSPAAALHAVVAVVLIGARRRGEGLA